MPIHHSTSIWSLIVTLGALAVCSSARAATLRANPEQVTTTRSANITQTLNTLDVTNLPPAAVKITGDGRFTKTNSLEGTITASIAGQVNAQQNEQFTTDYDFTFTLTGTGSVTWELEGKIQFPLIGFQTIFSETSPQPLVGPSSQLYTGSGSADVPLTLNNNFQAVFTVTWTGGAAGDMLTINVPNNSIDLAIVPEPGSMAMFGLAGIGLIARRRR